MNKLPLKLFVAILPCGCAHIPNQQPDYVLSYASIVNQIECEAFESVENIGAKRQYDWAKLHDWAFAISISPSSTFDGQISLGATRKSNDTKSYFQWLLGGTAASPAGIGYEGYGNNLGKNEYPLAVASLYEPQEHDGGGRKIAGHTRNSKLNCPALGGPLPSGAPKEFFDNGFFGVQEFLESSLDGNGNLEIPPKTIGYTKEYRKRFQAGITTGWYAPLGNNNPAAGGYALIDNIVGITFTPPSPPSKPLAVYIVPAPAKASKAKTAGRLSTPLKGVLPPDVSDRLTNGSNSLLQQQQLNKLIPDQ
jgi:hypothetical protein